MKRLIPDDVYVPINHEVETPVRVTLRHFNNIAKARKQGDIVHIFRHNGVRYAVVQWNDQANPALHKILDLETV